MLRAEHRLRWGLEQGILEKFGPKWDEVMGAQRQLHNEELHSFYSFLRHSYTYSFVISTL